MRQGEAVSIVSFILGSVGVYWWNPVSKVWIINCQFNILVPEYEIMEFRVWNYVVVDKFLYKLCLVWVNEKIDKKKSKVGSPLGWRWFVEKCALRTGPKKTKLYDKHDDFTCPITNCPFISSNILAAPAYRVYIS